MDPLLERARAGDRTAWSELAVATSDELRKFVERGMGERLKRRVAPDDLCQEALLQALGAIPALRADATIDDFRRLLLRNANWVVMDRGRRDKKLVGESVSPVEPGAVAQGTSPETRAGPVTRADDLRWMHSLVARLDSRFGQVIAARLAGKDFPEIALELGASEANVRKRYQRAVAALKQIIDGREAVDDSRNSPNSV